MGLTRFAFIFGVVISLLLVSSHGHGGVDPRYQDRFGQFLEDLKGEGFTASELDRTFSDSRFELYPAIVGRSGKGLNYMSRRFGLLTKASVRRGKSILATYRDVFREAEKEYGVQKEIIVAILRVETNFGASTGTYPILNSLTTMAVIENKRSDWARKEVVELLNICKAQKKDPYSIRGSWAGAFGISQFIPSSYTKFAVDGNKDGSIDLLTMSDAVHSVANYLKSHGWDSQSKTRSWQAVYAYNHCDNYVKAIFTYARALTK